MWIKLGVGGARILGIRVHGVGWEKGIAIYGGWVGECQWSGGGVKGVVGG